MFGVNTVSLTIPFKSMFFSNLILFETFEVLPPEYWYLLRWTITTFGRAIILVWQREDSFEQASQRFSITSSWYESSTRFWIDGELSSSRKKVKAYYTWQTENVTIVKPRSKSQPPVSLDQKPTNNYLHFLCYCQRQKDEVLSSPSPKSKVEDLGWH